LKIFENGIIKDATLEEWTKWFQTANRIIKRDTIKDILISTVFIGSNNILFESMVFNSKLEQTQIRTDTLEEALIAHELLIQRVKTKNFIRTIFSSLWNKIKKLIN
jgi:hypothetical protein